MPNKIKKIAFLGGSDWTIKDEAFRSAYDVAKLLAEHGYETVNGGGPGVMRASTMGAHDGGGRALAITYHPNKPKKHYEGIDIENHFDEEILTLDYFDRTKVMLQNTDAHIIFNGSLGTISELGMTWISSWIHYPNSKPIILYGKFWRAVIEAIGHNMNVTEEEESLFKICTSPHEVLEFIEKLDN